MLHILAKGFGEEICFGEETCGPGETLGSARASEKLLSAPLRCWRICRDGVIERGATGKIHNGKVLFLCWRSLEMFMDLGNVVQHLKIRLVKSIGLSDVVACLFEGFHFLCLDPDAVSYTHLKLPTNREV